MQVMHDVEDTEPKTARKWVLIVEDNALDMKLFSALLLAEDYEVLEAATGSEGIDLAREHRPDLIIMDIRLPDMSGLEATRTLKDDDRTRAIPVLATSAYGQYANKRQIRESGCDGYIPTPIDTGAFVRFVKSFVACAARKPAHAEGLLPVLIGPVTEVHEDT
jgi:two-component system cell cycle response regulator DivK